MRKNIMPIALLAILFTVGFSNVAFGQGVQTSGGVDVDGTWYLGEGLKEGNYFEYSLCELDLNDCAPVKLRMWVKGEIQNGSETLWDTKAVVIDGNKIIKGSMGLGLTAPEPVTFDDSLHDYAIAFKSSLSWLSAFATGNEDDLIHGPKEFRDNAWGKIGAIGGSQLIPKRMETISTPAGDADSVVVGWYSGNNNEIWIVDDFPFPVKALTYAWVTTGIAPVMYEFTLLDYEENVTDDPFRDIKPTIQKEELLGCPTDFHEYVSNRVATNTFSMMIQYNYSPEIPIEGCNIDWKINFMSKYNDTEFVDQIHYDIWVVDENNNRLRSYAQDLGRADLFNGFGQVHLLLPIEEKAGTARYAIFVHGTGPEYGIPDAAMDGYAIVEVEIAENPLLHEMASNDADGVLSYEIPSWIKQNAGWWASNQTNDDEFVSGIQFMIKEGIIQIPKIKQESDSVSDDIPSWIKQNAGWWAEGTISDSDFITGIEYLISNGMIDV